MIADKDGRIVPVHGDHHPVEVYAARESRNLIKRPYCHSNGMKYPYTQYGDIVAHENDDGSVRVVGTPNVSGNYTIWLNKVATNKAEGDAYIPLRAGMKLCGFDNETKFALWDKDGNTLWFDSGRVREVPRDDYFFRGAYLQFPITAGEYYDKTFYPMLAFSDTMLTEWEPYGTVTDTIFKPTNLKRTGTEVTFEKSYNHAAEVEVAGKSEQVQLTGKNLIPFPYAAKSAVLNGVSFTVNDDGSVTAKGTATGSSYFALNGGYASNMKPIPSWLEPGKTYTMSAGSTLPVGTGMHVYRYTSNTAGASYAYMYGGATSKTFTMPTNDSEWLYFGLFLYVQKDATVDFTWYPQLELGSTATAYEPYCGGTPSPNPEYPQPIESIESVKLASRRRNLLDVSTITSKFSSSVFTYEGGKIYNTSVNNWAGDYAYFNTFKLHSHSLVFSWRSYANGGVNRREYAFKPLFKAFDKDMNEITTGGVFENLDGWSDVYNSHYKGYFSARGDSNPFRNDGVTVNTQRLLLKDHVAYIQVGLCHSEIDAGVTGYICDYQLEEGSTANPYEPYHSTTRTIDLQGNKVRSLPDGTHDTLLLHRDGRCEIIRNVADLFLGDTFMNWGRYGNAPHSYSSGSIPGNMYAICSSGAVDGKIMCTHYRQGVTPWDDRYGDDFGINTTTQTYPSYIYVKDSRIDIQQDLKQFFIDNDVHAYYPLLTPQTIILPSIDPLPTYWDTTVIYDSEGNDISAFVKVVE